MTTGNTVGEMRAVHTSIVDIWLEILNGFTRYENPVETGALLSSPLIDGSCAEGSEPLMTTEAMLNHSAFTARQEATHLTSSKL